MQLGIGNSWVLIALVFTAALLLMEALYLMWQNWRGPHAQRLRQRLDTVTHRTPRISVLRQRLTDDGAPLVRLLNRAGRDRLEELLQRSGLAWSATGLIVRSLVFGLLAFVLVKELTTLSMGLAILIALGGASLPWFYLRFMVERRMAHIGRQLPDALDLITRALRAGHAFSAGLKMAGDEMPQPIAGELRAVHDEISFGISLQQALTHLCERVPLTDVRYFTVAVLVQRESGGNLTEILSDLSVLIRERAKLFARIRVLATEGRLSAWILGLMPFVLGGIMTLIHPKFMSHLWNDPIGVRLVEIMLALMFVGALMLRKIARIRV